MLIFGIILGIIYGILNISNFIKKRFITQLITDLIFSIIGIIVFIIVVNRINLGEIRTYLCVGYLLGFIIERISIGKLFAKGYKNVYNSIVKSIKRFGESKIGRFIFK